MDIVLNIYVNRVVFLDFDFKLVKLNGNFDIFF